MKAAAIEQALAEYIAGLRKECTERMAHGGVGNTLLGSRITIIADDLAIIASGCPSHQISRPGKIVLTGQGAEFARDES